MTPQNTPLEISEEAKALAKKISRDEPDHLARTAEYYWEVQAQDSINSATAKLREERDAWKASHDNQVNLRQALMDRPDLKERANLVSALAEERDQLLATVEGLREALQNSDALNRNMVEAAELETLQYFSEYKRTLKGVEQAFQSIPPTNLVKRSVLEKLINVALMDDEQKASCGPICSRIIEEAREELERTKS